MAMNEELQPLPLIEEAETGNRYVLYATPGGMELELRFEGEEPWATQKQMAELFGRDISVISRHLKAIFAEGELEEESNLQKMQIAGSDKPVAVYSLDVILAVGYRVSSKQGLLFRKWANKILRQYLLKGFVLDRRRLENPEGRPDFFDELLDKIREIRASEKRMWTRVLELASFCSGYHMASAEDKQAFFATIQNAMHWAIAQETAADFVYRSVDAAKPDCGVVHFDRERRDRPTTLPQFLQKMRDFIKLDGRPLIPAQFHGDVPDAKKKERVSRELGIYRERGRLEKEAKGEIEVGKLLEQARQIATDKREKRSKR
jgi:hypothetical protein